MKNKYLAVLLSCVLVLSAFAGCGSGETETQPAQTQTTQSTVPAAEPSEEATEASEAPSLKTEYPLTLEIYNSDNELVSMTFEKAPERVISTQLSATEILMELGLGDKIVGVFKNDNTLTGEYAEAIGQLNNMGDKKTVSKEAVLMLEPDLILGKAPSMFTDKSIGTVEYYQSNGIPVYTLLASAKMKQDIENIFTDILNIGKIFDVQDRANAYVEELREKLNTVDETLSTYNNEGEKKVLLMAGYGDGTFTAFKGAFTDCMLKKLHASNAAEKGGNGFASENLVAMNPDYIIYVLADRNAELDKDALEEIYANEAIQSVPAVANQKILQVPYDDIMDFGARNLDTLLTLCDFLHQ